MLTGLMEQGFNEVFEDAESFMKADGQVDEEFFVLEQSLASFFMLPAPQFGGLVML